MSIGDLKSQLESISEELGDLAISQIRDTLENGGEAGIKAEKKVTQARRAVEKAVHLLEEAEALQPQD